MRPLRFWTMADRERDARVGLDARALQLIVEECWTLATSLGVTPVAAVRF
jgi:hypothetical protein